MTGLRLGLERALEGLYPGARLETLPGDASTRRFHRLFLSSGATRVVMDYGVPFVGTTDDMKLSRIFESASLPVARILDVLPEAGALVLEDLGDETLEKALERHGDHASERLGLHRAATALASRIATTGTEALLRSDRASGPALDRERFVFEMEFFLDHYVRGFLDIAGAVDELRERLHELAGSAAEHPRVLCHRDYHSRNIMVRDDGTLAMVDIQDGRWGPDTYDVASLLRDAYVDIAEQDVDLLFEEFAASFGSSRKTDLRARFDIVATQRMIKALGTFGYQITVLKRNRYLDAIPRTINRLQQCLEAYPQTARIAISMRRVGVLGF